MHFWITAIEYRVIIIKIHETLSMNYIFYTLQTANTLRSTAILHFGDAKIDVSRIFFWFGRHTQHTQQRANYFNLFFFVFIVRCTTI